MFWWRKRSEGFEWREYVRTTILVRREERRRRLKDVQGAAAAHVKQAGRRGVEAAASGARAAGTGAWSGFKAAVRASGPLAARAARGTGHAIAAAAGGVAAAAAAFAAAVSGLAGHVGRPLAPVLEPVLSLAREPRPSLVLKVVAVAAGLGAAYRTWSFGFDGDAKMATVIAAIAASVVVLAALTDPDRHRRPRGESLLSRLGEYEIAFPSGRRLSATTAALGALALIALTAAGVAAVRYGASGSGPRVAAAPAAPATRTASDPAALESRRVQAVTGDTLRIAGTLVVLDGIEAPETGQSCQRASGRWRCGVAARDALARLVRGRSVACEVTGEHETGLKRARCTAGGADLAEKLVENGMVFTTGSFLSRYARIERKARAEKAGLWAGEAERPQDFRDKRWAEAKEKAPDGCPIKGRVRSGARTYVLPWSPAYDGIRLSKARGERWFCSESEAQAAGWSPGAPS